MQQSNTGYDFVQTVVPNLTEDEQIQFFNYTAQVDEMAKQKAKTQSPALTSQRKQGLVNQIYSQGGPGLPQGAQQ